MTCRLRLRIVPNARRNEVVGAHGDAIKVKIAAPALDGRANAELVEFIAETLGLSRRDISILGGEKSRDKVIEVHSLDEAEARRRFGITSAG